VLREIDGGPTWTTITVPTPGASNEGTTLSIGMELFVLFANGSISRWA